MSNKKVDAFVKWAESIGTKITITEAKVCASCGVAFIPPEPCESNNYLQTNVCHNCYCKGLQGLTMNLKSKKD